MSKEQEIDYIKARIAWINDHEKMFELSYCMKLERDALKDRLKELKGGEKQ